MRKRQLGFTDLGLLVKTVLVVAVASGAALIAFGSFKIAQRIFTGATRSIAFLAIGCFWAWAWLHWSFWSDGPQHLPRMFAKAECENELSELPARIEADGFLDEAASLQSDNILNLLSIRRLKFVEVEVQEDRRHQPRIAKPQGDSGFHIETNAAVGSYVRIELSAIGDPLCSINGAQSPSVVSRVTSPPFLPNTCIKLTTSERPTARYAIRHSSGWWPTQLLLGNWILFDRQNNREVARLSTNDGPTDAGIGNPATINGDHPLGDCRASHAILADKFSGSDSASENHPQVVTETTVRASVAPKDLDNKGATFPLVRPFAQITSYTDEEDEALIHRPMNSAGWADAVSQAKKTGWGAYGDQLLDWENRRLIKLKLLDENAYPWTTTAGEGSFWVRAAGQDWRGRDKNLLAQYDASGRLNWSVSVSGTDVGGVASDCGMIPYEMVFFEKHIWLHRPCGKDPLPKAGKTHQGVAWKIDRSDLPRSHSSAPNSSYVAPVSAMSKHGL